MFVVIANLLGIIFTWMVSSVQFNDASQALASGVYSATTIINYSVGKSIFLYLFYILIAIIFGLIFYVRYRKNNTEILNEKVESSLSINKKEFLFLIFFLGFIVFVNYFFAENIFSQKTFHSEEFYNLSALNELHYEKFDIIYPYSIGNILILDLFEKIGLNLLAYKIIINVLALFFLYLAISSFVSKRKSRVLYFLLIVAMYLQPIVSPSLHRNILRFIIPFLVLSSLMLINNILIRKSKLGYFYLFLVNLFILLFSSADIIVVSYVVYGLFAILSSLREKSIKKFIIYISAPIVSLLFLIIITFGKEVYFIKNQLLSIVYYSGFVNTNPYFNIFDIFKSVGLVVFVKNLVNIIIYYFPLFIIFNLFLFFLSNIKKNIFNLNSRLAYVLILTPTYFIYNRQVFGDAGIGRIGIAASILIFITILLRECKIDGKHLKFVYHACLVFFGTILVVNVYFLRHSFIDLYDAKIQQKIDDNTILCSDSFLSSNLKFSGYKYCDKYLVDNLLELKQVVGDNRFYIYDDSFSFYYIFSTRPITLIPSYSMSYTGQNKVKDKLIDNDIRYIIYPRNSNFFGVPENSRNDSNFMKIINAYMADSFEEVYRSSQYIVYKYK